MVSYKCKVTTKQPTVSQQSFDLSDLGWTLGHSLCSGLLLPDASFCSPDHQLKEVFENERYNPYKF